MQFNWILLIFYSNHNCEDEKDAPVEAKLDPNHIPIHGELSIFTVFTHVTTLGSCYLHALGMKGSGALVTQQQ